MEMQRYPQNPEDTELDLEALTDALNARRLGGMPPIIEFLVAERRIETFGALLHALDAAENWNDVGHFEIESTNIARSQSILGVNPDNPHPKSHGAVVAPYIIDRMIPVIQQVRDDVAERDNKEQEEEAGSPRKQLAA
jgi:hypothetical protein